MRQFASGLKSEDYPELKEQLHNYQANNDSMLVVNVGVCGILTGYKSEAKVLPNCPWEINFTLAK